MEQYNYFGNQEKGPFLLSLSGKDGNLNRIHKIPEKWELKKPRTTIPKCIFTALPLVTVVYLLVNISYLTVLTPREILSSDAVAISWADRVFPSLPWILPFAIPTSLFSSLLISISESSRPIYLASQEGQLPLLFNTLNRHSSPFTAVLLLVILGSLAIILTSLIDLINSLFFMSSFWSLLVMIGTLKWRYQEPNLSISFQVFLPFPLVAIVIDMGLVVRPLVKSPNVYYVYVLLLILNGLLFYIHLIHFKIRLDWFEKLGLQLLFNICLPDVSEEQMSEVQTVKKNSLLKNMYQIPNQG
nr:solute carrier family 7 member 13 [Aotus nancymaae]